MSTNIKSIRMPKAMFDKWQTDLRSGEYKQGTGALSTPDMKSFCCLGVLQHGIDGKVEGTHYSKALAKVGIEGFKPNGLPSCEWASRNGVYKRLVDGDEAGEWEELEAENEEGLDIFIQSRGWEVSSLNDGNKSVKRDSLTFVEIADLLLEEVETY